MKFGNSRFQFRIPSILIKPISPSQFTYGFISVLEIEGLGHCGGLLVVSQIGRPIEFHCSAPVSINRAQSILYGQTYQSYLYCEQIGLALIEKSKSQPQLFIADSTPLLALGELTEAPTVVLGNESIDQHFQSGASIKNRIGAPSIQTNQANLPSSFTANDRKLWTTAHNSSERSRIQKLAGGFTTALPWDEPFERIRTAIEEAQAVAR
jgi:hypothetical protein